MPYRPPLHWTYPGSFQIELYRSGWKGDRNFDRVVADIGGGRFAPVSDEEAEFVIKANTINKVRDRDIAALIVPSGDDERPIGLDTRLEGIRLNRGDTLVAGVSLFDDWSRAPITSSNWYAIPSAVPIPAGLILVKATRPTAAGAFHYTLGPAEPMSLMHFIILLTPLANDSRVVRVE